MGNVLEVLKMQMSSEIFNKRKAMFMNKKFGRLTISEYFKPEKIGTHYFTFVTAICECGNPGKYKLTLLKSGHTKSCGCLQTEAVKKSFTKHGKCRSSIYKVWCGMKYRCDNSRSANYHNYGGRGIKICNEWESFPVFYDWAINNGYSNKLEIDRINNDGNYSPDNCRFVTGKVNMRNSRKAVKITMNGMTKTIGEWCEFNGIRYGTYKNRRYRYKWPIEKCFFKKPNMKNLVLLFLITLSFSAKSQISIAAGAGTSFHNKSSLTGNLYIGYQYKGFEAQANMISLPFNKQTFFGSTIGPLLYVSEDISIRPYGGVFYKLVGNKHAEDRYVHNGVTTTLSSGAEVNNWYGSFGLMAVKGVVYADFNYTNGFSFSVGLRYTFNKE